jgi:23S rRNA (pseudouridine1915-N3)-methyltransferase
MQSAATTGMRLFIAAVGRQKPGPLRDLEQLYARRITWPLTIREVEERRPLPAAELKDREAALLKAALPRGATVVALDETGRPLTSPAFAEKLRNWQDRGVSDLAFVIGGADGLAAPLREQADFLLSLGAMTWPHLLARSLLLEQIYRGQQILTGHPYHRG